MEKRIDGWWFDVRGIEYGPYATRIEAIEAQRRASQFVRENPDFDGLDAVFDPTKCPFYRSVSMPKTAESKKPSPKKSSSKAAAKPAKRQPVKSTTSVDKPSIKAAEPTDRSMAKVPPTERRVAVVKAMRSMGATSATTGVGISAIAEKVGYTQFDVYGVISGTSGKAGSNPNCLMATGHAKVAEIEGKGKSYYLTASGKSTKFDDAPFVRASRAKK